jgi:transposase-like protein
MKETQVSTKRANFIRLAEARVTKALKAIKVVGNLSNKANYEYTDQDIQKIINALQAEISTLKSRFKNKGTGENIEFKLSK